MNAIRLYFLLCSSLLFSLGNTQLAAGESVAAESARNLAVVWSSGDPDIAHRIAFLYADTAKRVGWFEEVHLIVWGPSQRLLAADRKIQEYIQRMQASGVVVEACINCAEAYGIVTKIEALQIPVKPMGVPLTKFLKDPAWEVLTF